MEEVCAANVLLRVRVVLQHIKFCLGWTLCIGAIRCVGNHHMDYSARLERRVKLIVGRILGYCQDDYCEQLPGSFEAGSEIRSAVRQLYNEHSGSHVRSGRAPKGGKFVTAAEFNVCAALGQCIEDESQSKKVRLGYEVKGALGLQERGILCGGLARDVWNMQSEKDEEYSEPLRVSTKVWAIKKMTPGTWEGWHNTIQRYKPLQGIQSIHHARTQLNLVAGFHNYGVSQSKYEGCWKTGTSMPQPVPDRVGNHARSIWETNAFSVKTTVDKQ